MTAGEAMALSTSDAWLYLAPLWMLAVAWIATKISAWARRK